VIQHSTVNKTSATKLARVELKSRQNPTVVFSNLGHIIDLDLLRDCHRSLDGSKAVGIDGVTKDSYGKNLEANLADLLQRIRMGTCGVPQGSILSPLMCNVFLHHVVDEWFKVTNAREFVGRCSLTRYADDMVFTAPSVGTAQRLHALLSARLTAHGMTLHEGKIRVILNGRSAAYKAAITCSSSRVPSQEGGADEEAGCLNWGCVRF
jgi:Reverse transcriptase (RNA-dependent DNA polymerase)